MAIHGKQELQRRIEHVIRYCVSGDGRGVPTFAWGCALHGGSYSDATGPRDCWLLTTRAGETLPLTREALLALDTSFPTEVPRTPETAPWLMGTVPCSLAPPVTAVDGCPLTSIDARLHVGPESRSLQHLYADVGTIVRPRDCWQPLVFTTVVKPVGLPP